MHPPHRRSQRSAVRERVLVEAFVVTKYKGMLQEAEVPEPVVGEHDVLVQVQAAGLNQLDEKIRVGEFKQILPYKLPLILGNDVAGTVIRVGAKVRGFEPGDEVYARPDKDRIGTFAERIAVAEADLALKPGVDQHGRGGLAATGGTDRVAGTGGDGEGSARAEGSHPRRRGRSRVDRDPARQAPRRDGGHHRQRRQRGLGRGSSVPTSSSTTAARTSNKLVSGYDLVLDSLGGENLEKSLRILKPGGKAIGIAGPPDPAFARETGLNPALRWQWPA